MFGFIRVFVISFVLVWTQTLWAQVIVPVDDFPPWKIVSDEMVKGGLDIELTNTLLSKVQKQPKYLVLPWKRCLSVMQNGSADLISGVTKNAEREGFLSYFSFPYKTKSNKAFYIHRSRAQDIKKLSDLNGLVVGVLREAKYFPEFDSSLTIKKYDLTSDEQGLVMLKAHRLDAVIMTQENARYLLTIHPDLSESIKEASYLYHENIEVYFAISKKSDLMKDKDKLENALKLMLQNHEVEKILSGRHYSKNGKP